MRRKPLIRIAVSTSQRSYYPPSSQTLMKSLDFQQTPQRQRLKRLLEIYLVKSILIVINIQRQKMRFISLTKHISNWVIRRKDIFISELCEKQKKGLRLNEIEKMQSEELWVCLNYPQITLTLKFNRWLKNYLKRLKRKKS